PSDPERATRDARPGPKGRQLHNTHHFEAVTIYYRWHPLCGYSLSVYDRKKTRQGEFFVCRCPDSTTLAVPAWMLNPECAQFSLGPPLVAVEALLELRDLFTSLRLAADCDKASLKSSLQEEAHEATREAPQSAVQSAASGSPGAGRSPRETEGTGSGAGGTTD